MFSDDSTMQMAGETPGPVKSVTMEVLAISQTVESCAKNYSAKRLMSLVDCYDVKVQGP